MAPLAAGPLAVAPFRWLRIFKRAAAHVDMRMCSRTAYRLLLRTCCLLQSVG